MLSYLTCEQVPPAFRKMAFHDRWSSGCEGSSDGKNGLEVFLRTEEVPRVVAESCSFGPGLRGLNCLGHCFCSTPPPATPFCTCSGSLMLCYTPRLNCAKQLNSRILGVGTITGHTNDGLCLSPKVCSHWWGGSERLRRESLEGFLIHLSGGGCGLLAGPWLLSVWPPCLNSCGSP